MINIFLTYLFFSTSLWSAPQNKIQCENQITTVAELDECLKKNDLKPTKSTKEILEWKKRLNISSPLVIDPVKVQEIVVENCDGKETPRQMALKLSQEVEKILQAGNLQIKDWRVPNFPATGAKDYGMKKSRGCNPLDLIKQMKQDVDGILPDLMNVYNFGLAIDTTESQDTNMAILAQNIDFIYSSLPTDAKIAFSVTAYGDEFRGGLKFEGDKNYVIPRVKNFILSQRIYGGGAPAEFVYGGSYITSKNLQRAHGLIFNWTNAPADNTKAQTRYGKEEYTLRGLSGFANQNVHVIRNVFLKCQ